MKVLVAHRLTDGEVVWLGAGHRWAETIEAAETADCEDAEARLEAIGKAAYERNEVIDAELIDVELVGGVPVPIRLRERIRSRGPSNRADLGKQAGSRAIAAKARTGFASAIAAER